MATSSVVLGGERATPASLLSRFLFAGATVAVLDGAFAVVAYVSILHLTTATRIFQSIAAGLLGKAAYDGGTSTAALGVLCHFIVAFGWTTVYLVLSRRITSIRQFASSNAGTIITGLAYGAVMWLAMNFVVVPNSAAHRPPVTNWQFWLQLVWHMIALGPPIVRILR